MKRVSVFRTNKSEAGYFSSLKLIGLTPTFLQTAAAALLANCAISFRGYFCAKARAAIDRVLGRIAAPNIPTEISEAPVTP